MIDAPAFPSQQGRPPGTAEALADLGQIPQALWQIRVPVRLYGPARRSPVQHHQSTRPPLGVPMPLYGMAHGLFPLHGPYDFFTSTSLSSWISSAWSATSRFKRWFSSSSCFSRRASDTPKPPYLLRHL